MGSKSTENLIMFGDAFISTTDHHRVVLSCSFSEPCEFDVIVHDKQGRAVINKTIEADVSTKEVSFDVSRLEAGHYHIWLYLKDGTVIRDFNIANDQIGKEGVLGKLANLFKRSNLIILTSSISLDIPMCLLQPFVEG